MPDAVSISAPAKINLALAVAPPEAAAVSGAPNPRAGWHRIASLFSCIDLSDTLHLRRLASGPSRFSVRWADDAPKPTAIDWAIEKDLSFRAHALLEKHHSRALPVEVVIEKRIPVGGGLGGGSSDAAAMLAGLNTMFDLGWTHSALAPISASLGSDVAFFLDEGLGSRAARPALVEGFGDRIERRAPFDGDVVLIFPPVGCPTPAVYRAFDSWLSNQSSFRFREREVRALFLGAGTPDSGAIFNDLAVPAFAVAPEVRAIHAEAERVVRPVHVTGSGSTLFVPAARGEGARLADTLAKTLESRAVVLLSALR